MPDSANQHGLFYEGGEPINGIKVYLLSVFAAAIICAIVTRLIGTKGIHGSMVKLIAGLFLAFAVIRPGVDLSLDTFMDFAQDYSQAGQQAAAAGESLTKETITSGIKARTEAYILDKATALDVELKVEVTLSDEEIPCPIAVRLCGKVSPYVKAQLQAMITQDLGIKKEHQIWT